MAESTVRKLNLLSEYKNSPLVSCMLIWYLYFIVVLVQSFKEYSGKLVL